MRYHQLCTKLFVDTTDSVFTQAVDMAGANSVFYEVTALEAGSGTRLNVALQISNDLANWASAGVNLLNLTPPVYSEKSSTAEIAARYVRLRFSVTVGGEAAIVAAGIWKADL